jgi:hypothetical protein
VAEWYYNTIYENGSTDRVDIDNTRIVEKLGEVTIYIFRRGAVWTTQIY